MITEQQEEQASLYVLGALPADEAARFEAALKSNAELRELTRKLRDASASLALGVKPVAPPAELKTAILAALPAPKMVRPEFRSQKTPGIIRLSWVPWALAACLAMVCGLLLLRERSLHDEIARLESKGASQSTQLAMLQSAVDEFKAEDNVSRMSIAMLGSLLENSPKAVAVSVWDAEKQDGVLVVQNLAPLPADKDYQLWVIDPKDKTPVDAGVFSVDAKGAVRLRFKPKASVNTAGTFAVTLEKKGGVSAPQGSMVLAGNTL